MKEYTTIAAMAEDEFVEKRSRFLCAIAPVQTPEEAAAFIAARREQHRDARHTVWAYLLRAQNAERCSDDGEPQGTGGVPALEVLRRSGLTDVCVAVTRYFGGVLLGAPGLTRAYSAGAGLAVAAAERVTYCACARLLIPMAYPQYNIVQRLLPQFEAVVEDSDFGESVTLQVLLREEREEALRAALSEATAGTVTPELLERPFAAL